MVKVTTRVLGIAASGRFRFSWDALCTRRDNMVPLRLSPSASCWHPLLSRELRCFALFRFQQLRPLARSTVSQSLTTPLELCCATLTKVLADALCPTRAIPIVSADQASGGGSAHHAVTQHHPRTICKSPAFPIQSPRHACFRCFRKQWMRPDTPFVTSRRP